MLLSEVSNNTQINIQFALNDKHFDFPVKILGSSRGFILTEPVMVNEKVLDFSSNKIHIELLLNRENERPVVWKTVKIATVRSKAGSKYCIKDTLGKEINRRATFRTFVGINGFCQMGSNTKPKEVTCRDISTVGFSFVAEDDFGLTTKQICHINFEDSMLGYSFSLNGIIERIQELEDGKVVFGCRLTKRYNGLDEYINIKQREQLARTSGLAGKFNYDRYKHVRISIK